MIFGEFKRIIRFLQFSPHRFTTKCFLWANVQVHKPPREFQKINWFIDRATLTSHDNQRLPPLCKRVSNHARWTKKQSNAVGPRRKPITVSPRFYRRAHRHCRRRDIITRNKDNVSRGHETSVVRTREWYKYSVVHYDRASDYEIWRGRPEFVETTVTCSGHRPPAYVYCTGPDVRDRTLSDRVADRETTVVPWRESPATWPLIYCTRVYYMYGRRRLGGGWRREIDKNRHIYQTLFPSVFREKRDPLARAPPSRRCRRP